MPLKAPSPDVIVLVENGPPVETSLTPRENQQLSELNHLWRRRLGLSRDPFLYQQGLLSARDVTGFTQIDTKPLEVAPKFLSDGRVADARWRAAVWAILARIYRVPILAGLSAGAITRKQFLPDLLGYVLLASIRTAALQGWPSGYVEVFGHTRVLKGRLALGRILDAVLYPGLLPCEYEEFSLDVPANRLVKWAAEQLSRVVRSPILGRDLMDQVSALPDVSSRPPPPQIAERISLPPTGQSLAPAVRVGQLLLTGRSLRHGAGDESLPGFLWNSSDVFELFAKRLVRRTTSLLPNRVRFLDSALWLGISAETGARLRTTPDIRLVTEGGHLAVLDAKYKVWKGQPVASDSYQVVAGGWVAGCNNIGLVYPSPKSGRKEPLTWRLTGRAPPRRLWAIFLDLVRMAEARGEELLLHELAADLQQVVESP